MIRLRIIFIIVEFDNVSFDLCAILCGIPQGSILGPLLFILYISGISNSPKLLKFILFAEDTNIFYSCCKLNNLGTSLNNELGKVSQWLIASRLAINIKKTIKICCLQSQAKKNW